MIRQTLNGTWSFCAADMHDWMPAEVPGTVVEDLLRNKAIEDPYFRTNEYETRALFEHDYEYTKTFTVSAEMLAEQNVELVCHGIDTAAVLYLNDAKLGEADNMHRTWRFNAKPLLRAGENTLRVLLLSPLQYVRKADEESADVITAVPVSGTRGNQYMRKVHSSFGWDWGPQLIDAGIWRDIELQAYTARLDSVHVRQSHDEGSCALHLQAQPAGEAGENTSYRAELLAPDGSTLHDVGGDADIGLVVQNPQLWWPNGYGAQPLYTLRVSMLQSGKVCDVWEKKIGLRTLTISQQPDEWGSEFCFVVNGVKIFAMGADYIPEDAILARVTPERTERLVRDCVAANYNCLRVWGGGYYPSDEFYDSCDRHGIIVWQDLMFACNAYSLTRSFEQNIIEEVRDNVRRLRHHASLGVWCGNNEIECGWVEWDVFQPLSAKLRADYIRMFELILPRIVEENDADTFYWLSSPSSGGGFDEPSDATRGDVHYWAVWHQRVPFSEYRNNYFRFCSEFGFQSFPSLKTVESYTLPQDRNIFSAVMESHQKNPSANGLILYYLSETFLYPKDFDSMLYVSQLLQAEAIRCGVEHWRRNRGRCMGALYWQLNDCWPVASWASLDYFGRWKALHYYAKRFFQHQTVSVEDQGAQMRYYMVNEDTAEWRGSLKVRLCKDDFTVLREEETSLICPPGTSAEAMALDFGEEAEQHGAENLYAAYELYIDGALAAQDVTLLTPPKHHAYQPAGAAVEVEDAGTHFACTVKAGAMCQFVELSVEGHDVVFSDNFFAIGTPAGVCVTVEKDQLPQGTTAADLQRLLRVRSIVDSYSV